jgi:hypothetical protein
VTGDTNYLTGNLLYYWKCAGCIFDMAELKYTVKMPPFYLRNNSPEVWEPGLAAMGGFQPAIEGPQKRKRTQVSGLRSVINDEETQLGRSAGFSRSSG